MKKNVLIFFAGLFFLAVWTTAMAETYVPGKRSTGIVNWGNGKVYFFNGNRYIRYDITTDKADSGYPKLINAETWPGIIWTDGVDAVVNWGNGKAYFFKGSQYIRYDIKTNKADPGYPKTIDNSTWPGITW